MQKLRMLVAAAVCALASMVVISPAVSAYNCPEGTLRAGASVTNPAKCNVEEDAAGADLMSTVRTILNVILSVLGLVAVIVIILGGFTYMTSQGDPSKVKRGKDTIMYGVIGLVVALLAFAIVNFVLNNVFNGGSSANGSGSGSGSGGSGSGTSGTSLVLENFEA